MYYLVSETKGVTAKQKIIVLHPKMNSLQKNQHLWSFRYMYLYLFGILILSHCYYMMRSLTSNDKKMNKMKKGSLLKIHLYHKYLGS